MHQKAWRMDGRTDRRTNNPEAICPSNFFEVGGIMRTKKLGLGEVIFQGKQLCQNIFSLFWKGIYSMRKEFLSLLSRFFFWWGWCAERETGSNVKLFPSYKMAKTFAMFAQKKKYFSFFFFALRFNNPVNQLGSCRVQSIYQTTLLLGRLSPLSGSPGLCTFFRQQLTTALLDSAEGIEWPQKIFYGQISSKERCQPEGGWTQNLLITSWTGFQLSH